MVAPRARPVSSCSFIDGARAQEKQTSIVAGGMGLDLGKGVPMVQSGHMCCTGPPEVFRGDKSPFAMGSFGGQLEGKEPELFPTPRCPSPFSHALPLSC